MGMPCSFVRWQLMKRGREETEGKRKEQGEIWQTEGERTKRRLQIGRRSDDGEGD